MNENGRLDWAPVLAFDICFPVANVPVITVLNENGRLDRAPVLALDICFPVANVPVITVLNENGRLDRAPVQRARERESERVRE